MQVSITSGIPTSFPENRVKAVFNGTTNCVFVLDTEIANPTSETITAIGATVLTATPKTVTNKFFGINTGEASGAVFGSVNPIEDMSFGLVRSHDTANLGWKDIELTSGNYTWTHFDAWVTAHYDQGRDLLFTVYQTPTFHSARPTDDGPYGTDKGYNAEPANYATLAAFVSAAATRAAVTLGRPIKYWEVSNEPNYVHSSGTRFYTGTVGTLAIQARTINQAVKAVIPTALIISPSCTNWDNSPAAALPADVATTYCAAMLAASDGAAGTMADWIDLIGYHSYGSDSLLKTRVDAVKTVATAAGLSAMPIIDTEVGVNAGATMSDSDFYKRIGRMYITQAALGVSAMCMYQLGSTLNTGYSIESRPVFKAALNRLIRRVTTYGITSAGMMPDGTVYATIDGETETF